MAAVIPVRQVTGTHAGSQTSGTKPSGAAQLGQASDSCLDVLERGWWPGAPGHTATASSDETATASSCSILYLQLPLTNKENKQIKE